MRFEVEKNDTSGAERIRLVPSTEDGVFIVDDPEYKKRYFKSLGLAAIGKDDIDAIKRGRLGLDDVFIEQPDGVRVANDRFEIVGTYEIPHSGNSVTSSVAAFQEAVIVTAL